MTVDKAIEKIISKPRYYDGIMAQPQASVTVKHILNGTASATKTKNFLEKFGYKVDVKLKVEKV